MRLVILENADGICAPRRNVQPGRAENSGACRSKIRRTALASVYGKAALTAFADARRRASAERRTIGAERIRAGSEGHAVDNASEIICAAAEGCFLICGKRSDDLSVETVLADYAERAEAYIVHTVFSVHHGGYGHRRVRSAEYAAADVTYGNRDRIERRTLACDDLCAGFLLCRFRSHRDREPDGACRLRL